jgi:hypothetical protein
LVDQPPSVWTIEVLLYLFTVVDGYIAGFTTFPTVGGTSDRTLYIAGGKFGIYVGGINGPEHIELGTAEPGIYHLIATCSGTVVTLSIKDHGSASFSTSTGGSQEYLNISRATEINDERILEANPTPPLTATRGVEEPPLPEDKPFFVIGRARTDTPYPFLPLNSRTFDGVVMLANVTTAAL